MKRHFVLDENIIILAQTGTNDHGQVDLSCLELLQAMEQNCHALVLGPSSWQRYSSQIRTLQRQRLPLVPNVLVIVKSLLTNLEKDTITRADHELAIIDSLDQVRGVDAGDLEFVRLAASVPRSILVTTDGPLTNALKERGIDQQHEFSVLSPADALVFAGPDS